MIRSRFLWPLVEARAAATPDALFAVDESERRLGFAAYRDACLGAARALAARGIGPGTVVSWQLPTTLPALVLAGGLARLGAVQNPILPMLREREVGFITRQVGSRVLFVPAEHRGFDFPSMAQAALAGTDVDLVVLPADLPHDDAGALPPAPEPCALQDAPVRWILYSSGTTADPKGARHADPSLIAPGQAMVDVLELGPEDRHAFVFPLTHVGGIHWLAAGLIAGFGHVLIETFDPVATPLVLADHGVTVAGAGTVFHQAYLAAQRAQGGAPLLPAVRVFPGGGAPKPPQLYRDLKETTGAPIVSGYGLTEHPIASMGTVNDPDEKLAHTEGRATAGTEIRVVTLAGEVAEPGVEGEICVRGPHLFRGYVDASLDAPAFDAEGFFRTGDLGNLDAEGYLTITGRLKDVILRKGENISAKEVEDHLHAHPDVADVAVIGLPDVARGERVCAVIVPVDREAPLRFEAMAEWLRGRGLAVQKLPEQLELAEALPRNASGKILKRELQQRYMDA